MDEIRLGNFKIFTERLDNYKWRFIITEDEENNDERYMDGTIKWDGCSHLYFGDSGGSGYLHFCGKESYTRHTELMSFLFEKASKVIKGWEHKGNCDNPIHEYNK